MEPLLKRIAESVERMERKQPPSMPDTSPAVAQTMPQPSQPSQQSPANATPQQFANAGNLNIEPGQGQNQPSFLGRAAIQLQSITNMMADYGVKTPPALQSMLSSAKVGSLMAGDQHTRIEKFASKGLRPDVSGDESALLRSAQFSKGRDSSTDSDPSPGIARNDLKDSLDSLKESVDQLKDAVKGMATVGKQTPANGPTPSQSPKAPTATRSNMGQVRNALLSIARPANVAANTI